MATGSTREDDAMEPYIDEEVALGFHVWVAELELLVGTAKGRRIDQVQLLTCFSHYF